MKPALFALAFLALAIVAGAPSCRRVDDGDPALHLVFRYGTMTALDWVLIAAAVVVVVTELVLYRRALAEHAAMELRRERLLAQNELLRELHTELDRLGYGGSRRGS